MDAHLKAALAARAGVARTCTLLQAGCTEKGLAAAVAAGVIRRVRHGVLALPDADPAVILAVTLNGEVTCVTALARHGIALLKRTRVAHVAVRAEFSLGRREVRNARLHYGRDPASSVAGPAVDDVPRALDVAGRCLSARAHLVAVDSALHQGLVRPDQVAEFTVTRASRREWLLAHVDARAESVGETLARLDCAEAGLAVHPQRFISGVGRVDLVVEDRVIVEVDGQQFHDDPESFRRDRRRDRRVSRQRMPVLRFAHGELTGARPPNVAEEVRAVLEAGD